MYSMEYYLQKTHYKTASLISNSCKAVAILAGHTADVSMLAYEYGRNLVNYPALVLILKRDYFKLVMFNILTYLTRTPCRV
jgi:hypothetical protein